MDDRRELKGLHECIGGEKCLLKLNFMVAIIPSQHHKYFPKACEDVAAWLNNKLPSLGPIEQPKLNFANAGLPT
jgi:hypothetical protein